MPDEVHLGEQYWHDIVPFELTLVNDSPEPITVKETRAPCDCTIVDRGIDGMTLEPGAAATIHGQFSTGGRVGYLRKPIAVVTEDGSMYVGYVAIDVTPSYEVYPAPLHVQIGETPGTAELRFRSKSARILSITADSSWLSADADGDRILVTVDSRGVARGVTHGLLILRTNDRFLPACAVPVIVSKTGGIDFRPSHLFFSTRGPASGQVVVRAEASVVSAVCPDDRVAVQIRDHAIVVTLRPEGGTWTTSVTVLTSDGVSDAFKVTMLE